LYLGCGHVDDVGLGCVAELDVSVGEMVEPGQLPTRELLAERLAQLATLFEGGVKKVPDPLKQGFGSVTISYGSGSRFLKMNADPDPGLNFLKCYSKKS